MLNLLSFAVLVASITSAHLTVYPEHNPVSKTDFLHIHFTSPDLDSKLSDKPIKKIIYDLGTKLRHDETFVIKICPEGSIQQLEKNPADNQLYSRCLSDNYDSLIGFNHNVDLPIYQFKVRTYYKTCFFGGAVAEAERSLVNTPAEELKKGGKLQNKDLFMTDVDDIIKTYEDTKDFNYRLTSTNNKKSKDGNGEYENSEEFRCTLQYNKQTKFDYESFTHNIKLIPVAGAPSILVIEYKGKEIEKSKEPSDSIKYPLKDGDQVETRKKKVVNSLMRSTRFKFSKFDDIDFSYKISTTKKGKSRSSFSIGLVVPEMKEIKTQYPLSIPKHTYLRFVPFLCKSMMSDNDVSSYMFMDSKDCTVVGDSKILIANVMGEVKFYQGKTVANDKSNAKEEKKNTQKKEDNKDKNPFDEEYTVGLLAMNFLFHAKDDPDKEYSIVGFEERVDVMYDAKRGVVYHITYQKNKTSIKGVEQQDSESKTSLTLAIEINKNTPRSGRILMSSATAQKTSLMVIGIFSCVLMGAVFYWGSTILAMISFLIIIVFLLLMASNIETRRILVDEVNTPVETEKEYKSAKNMVDLMSIDDIKRHQDSIKYMSNVTLKEYRAEREKQTDESKRNLIRRVIVLQTDYIAEIEKAAKMVAHEGVENSGFNADVTQKVKEAGEANLKKYADRI